MNWQHETRLAGVSVVALGLLLLASNLHAESRVDGWGLGAVTSPQPDQVFEPSLLFGMEFDAVGRAGKEVDDLSEPPLIWQLNAASARGDVSELSRLLAHVPADAVMADTGMTALMVAADASTASILIQSGAEVNRADPHGWTALHHAVTRAGGAALVARLLQAGADTGRRNDRGETPLLLSGLLFTEAIDRQGGPAVIHLLVGRGRADIDTLDRDGWTLLHRAASNDEPGLARLCLLLGADPDIATQLQETPRAMAQRLHSHAFIDALMEFERGQGK